LVGGAGVADCGGDGDPRDPRWHTCSAVQLDRVVGFLGLPQFVRFVGVGFVGVGFVGVGFLGVGFLGVRFSGIRWIGFGLFGFGLFGFGWLGFGWLGRFDPGSDPANSGSDPANSGTNSAGDGGVLSTQADRQRIRWPAGSPFDEPGPAGQCGR
jgi:hypothetical protein